MTPPIVIAGSGLAGFTVARELRKRDVATPVTIITADDGSYYSKPTLSNALATQTAASSLVINRPEVIAKQLKIEIWPHSRVETIDTGRREIMLADQRIQYSKLVLAVGADPISPLLEGNAATEVVQVNDLASYLHLREKLSHARHVLIIGAGLVGCEFANDIAGIGIKVTVVDLMDYPLARFCPKESGDLLREALAAAGVHWRLCSQVRALDRRPPRLVATLADGYEVECDLVLAAIGLRPRIALASEAGLRVAKGICTDSRLKTSGEDVFAIGDCSEVAGQLRPFVMPIMVEARSLAATLSGRETPVEYSPMPVIVKTPACPAVLLPPDDTANGGWHVERVGDSCRGIFREAGGIMRGFALFGTATRERQALLREMVAIGAGAGAPASVR